MEVEAMAAMEGKGEECEFGVFGMGTMGQNLALNVASRGFVVAAYTGLTSSRTESGELLKGRNKRERGRELSLAWFHSPM